MIGFYQTSRMGFWWWRRLPNTAGQGGSGAEWANVNNIKDGLGTTSATVGLGSGLPTSRRLEASNFGFSIPHVAVIRGIDVRVRCRRESSDWSVNDNDVRLRINGGLSGNKKGSGGWSTNGHNRDYGNETDMWGFTGVTPAMINDAGFQFRLTVNTSFDGVNTARVWWLETTVWYRYYAG